MRKIVMGIIWGIHAVFALLLLLQIHFTPQKKEHKPLLVKTITPKITPCVQTKPVAKAPQKKQTTTTQSVAASSHPQPKKETPKPVPPAKKTVPTPSPAKKSEPAIADKKISKEKKNPSPQPSADMRSKISDTLLQELEESIAKITQKADKKGNKEKGKPSPVLSLEIDNLSSDPFEESSYVERLIGHLHESLQLPDYGEVKIQLSLRQDGSVVKITVLSAKSQKNKRYLEENLPHLRFPRFEGSLKLQKESSFILTFVNEM